MRSTFARVISRPQQFNHQSGQRGVVLFVALIVLVVMSLAGIGLMRSVDTSTGIAGNLAFRASAVTSADASIELAMAFLEANRGSSVLNNDVAAQGYYAVADLSITGATNAPSDWSRYDWAGRSRKIANADESGNTIQYVIERLCSKPNASNSVDNRCAKKVVQGSEDGANNSKGAGTPGNYSLNYLSFRITTMVTDPKGSATYIQVMSY